MCIKDVKEFTPAGTLPLGKAASISATDSPKLGWATIAGKAAGLPLTTTKPATVPGASTTPQILRNRKGQRVDPSTKQDKKEQDRVKSLKVNFPYVVHLPPTDFHGRRCVTSTSFEMNVTMETIARMCTK